METPENEKLNLRDERLVLEAYRLAEQNLQSQVDIARAADKKSATFCGLVVAALAALVGLSDLDNFHWTLSVSTLLLTFCGLVVAALAALVGLSDLDNSHWTLSVSTLLLTASAVASALSLRPVQFFVRGLPFENFNDDIEASRDFLEVVKELSGIYDDCLTANKNKIRSNARLFRIAVYTALAGIVFLVFTTVIDPLLAELSSIFNLGDVKL